MKRIAAIGALGLFGCMPVDAIDQKAADCERAMLPRILHAARSLPSDNVLRAKNVTIEHELEGGEKRLQAIEAKIHAKWKATDVQPIDEITHALLLSEDAVGFAGRAEKRTKQLCAFAEANRVKYQRWSYGALGLAGSVSQTPPTNAIEEVVPE